MCIRDRRRSGHYRVDRLFSIPSAAPTESIGLRPGHPRRQSERPCGDGRDTALLQRSRQGGAEYHAWYRAGVWLRRRGGARPGSGPDHVTAGRLPRRSNSARRGRSGPDGIQRTTLGSARARRVSSPARRDGGTGAAWSPDGQTIVYASGNDLFLAKSDGAEPHKLVTAPDWASDLAWSPNGRVIQFSIGNQVARPTQRLSLIHI